MLVDFLLHLVEIDVGNGILAVENTCDVLEGGAFCLHIEEVDEGELAQIPQLEEVSERILQSNFAIRAGEG